MIAGYGYIAWNLLGWLAFSGLVFVIAMCALAAVMARSH